MKIHSSKLFVIISILNVLSLNTARSQIIYTDIIPDSDFTVTSTYDLDLNNDGVVDFIFYYSKFPTTTHGCAGLSHYTSYLSLKTLDSNKTFTSYLSTNDLIDTSTQWNDSVMVLSRSMWSFNPDNGCVHSGYGAWLNCTDCYVGLKLRKGTFDYYGWVRLSVIQVPLGPLSHYLIKDYAYNSNPGQLLFAGDTINVFNQVTDHLQNTFSIYASNKIIHIKTNVALMGNEFITISNSLGRILKKQKLDSTDLQIEMENYGPGLYFISLERNEFINSTKVFVW